MKSILKRLKNTRGATAIEYGLMAGLVAVTITTAVTVTGDGIKMTLCEVENGIVSGSCAVEKSGEAVNLMAYAYANKFSGGILSALTPIGQSIINDPVATISGLYDADGNAITTMDQLRSILDPDVSQYGDAIFDDDGYTFDSNGKAIGLSQDFMTAYSNLTANSPQIKISQNGLSMTTQSGITHTFTPEDAQVSGQQTTVFAIDNPNDTWNGMTIM